MRRVTVSLPDDVAEAVEKLIKENEFRKTSHLFVDALREYVKVHYPELLPKEKPGPTVLKSLKAQHGLRAPSPTLMGRTKLEGFRME